MNSIVKLLAIFFHIGDAFGVGRVGTQKFGDFTALRTLRHSSPKRDGDADRILPLP